jgi:hypothetical protein
MFLAAVWAVSPLQAYVGPGPGLSMLQSLLTLVSGVFLSLFMVVFYPIRLVIKKMRRARQTPTIEHKEA